MYFLDRYLCLQNLMSSSFLLAFSVKRMNLRVISFPWSDNVNMPLKQATFRFEKLSMKDRLVCLLLLECASSAVSEASSSLPWHWWREENLRQTHRKAPQWEELFYHNRHVGVIGNICWKWSSSTLSSGLIKANPRSDSVKVCYLGTGFECSLPSRGQRCDGKAVWVFSISNLWLFH